MTGEIQVVVTSYMLHYLILILITYIKKVLFKREIQGLAEVRPA